MKKILLAAFVIACSFSVRADEPNEKVLDAFNKTFRGAQEISWSENNYTYEVRFKQNEVVSRVTYDKQGNIVRTLRYYYEQQLPMLVLSKVKNRFPSKKVFGVTEESFDETTIYHIVLEDEKSWMDVTSDSYGSLTVEKKYKKN